MEGVTSSEQPQDRKVTLAGPKSENGRAEKYRTPTRGARTGLVRRRTNFTSSYGARRVLMHALRASCGFRYHKQPIDSPCGDFKGPVRPYDARAGFLQILVVEILLHFRQGAPHGSFTGPVGFEKHWRFPRGSRTTPTRASHRVQVECCELFDLTISHGIPY